jgi:uncharacterized protein (DUF427 family)
MALRIEPCAKRVRAYVGGTPVADSARTLFVWDDRPYPTYYFPASDVRMDLFAPGSTDQHFTIKVSDTERVDAAWRQPDNVEELHDYVRFDWNSMDSWFEEDEEVYTHARSPYARIDILTSSRAVRVERDGVVLAESNHARVLFETGLPARWYIPKVDVRMELLTPTDSVTHCPYKGQAEYWSVRIGDRVVPDLAWSYRSPLPESQKIAGLVCFYNERVDLFIDGELQDSPHTKFS